MPASLKRNSAWQLVQTVSGTGAELVILLSLAAMMSAPAFGRLAIALSGTKLLYLLFEPRIHEFLTPKLARYLDRSRRGSWMWVMWSRRFELRANLTGFATTLALAALVPHFSADASTKLFVVAAIYNGCNTLMKFSSLAIFRCLGDMRTAAGLSIMGALLKLGWLAVGVFFKWEPEPIVLGLSAMAALTSIPMAVRSRQQLRKRVGEAVSIRGTSLRPTNRDYQLRLLRSNYGTGLVEIAHRELDVQIAAWFGGAEVAGRYRVAKTLAMTMLEALTPIVVILLAELSRRLFTQSRAAVVSFVRRISAALAVIGMVAGMVVAAGAAAYFTWFAAKQASAGAPMLVLVVSFALLAPGMWAQAFLVAANRPQLYLRSSAIGAGLACTLAALLVPKFGAIGSAIGHAGGLAVTTGLAVWTSVRVLREWSFSKGDS